MINGRRLEIASRSTAFFEQGSDLATTRFGSHQHCFAKIVVMENENIKEGDEKIRLLKTASAGNPGNSLQLHPQVIREGKDRRGLSGEMPIQDLQSFAAVRT